MQEKERKSEADFCFCWYNLLISSIKSRNWGEDCTAAANVIAQLLVSHKGISILQVNIAGGRKWLWIMGYVQEFSIMGAVGPCRMFILSKRSQLRTSLRNYSVFNVGKSCCC